MACYSLNLVTFGRKARTDMKITQVKSWKENLELTRPYTIAYRTIDHVENVFLYIELENGLAGIGAGSPAEFVTGESVSDSIDAIDDYAQDLLAGQDIRHFQALIREAARLMPDSPAALACVDIALHDAFARYLGVPLVDFLGRAHHRLPTSITIGIQSLDNTLREAAEFIRAGFRVIKLKTGKSVEEDIETVSRLRETVGPDIHIRVDANQGYSAADLRRFAAATQSQSVEFYEQPLPPKHLETILSLPDSLRRRCAADEDLHGPADAVRMAAPPQPYGIYNIKLMKCGGIAAARQIAAVAEHSGLQLMWGCNDESIVSITAALHAALASPATRYLDLDGSFDLARDVVDGGFILKDGYLFTGGAPGLGVRLIDF